MFQEWCAEQVTQLTKHNGGEFSASLNTNANAMVKVNANPAPIRRVITLSSKPGFPILAVQTKSTHHIQAPRSMSITGNCSDLEGRIGRKPADTEVGPDTPSRKALLVVIARQQAVIVKLTRRIESRDIEDASPPALTIHMEGVGTTGSTNCWTSSHWPIWWQAETTYAFSDGRELEEGEAFPPDSISAKDWRREFGQEWDSRKTLKDNLLLREEYAFFNAQLWMTNVGGLSMETLHGIARGEVIQASTGSQCYSFQILPDGKCLIP